MSGTDAIANRLRAEAAESALTEARAEAEHWKHHAWEAGEGFKRAIKDTVKAYDRRRAAEARAEAAEAALVSEREAHAGLRARLEALTDRFERWPSSPSLSVTARHLRAALAAEPAEATASRPPETSGAGSIAPVAAEEGGEQKAGEARPILCGSNGGRYSPFGHQCSCNRQAGHPLDSPRPHGCSCGAPWSCEDCADADPYMGCAGCGAVGSPGDDQSIYVTRRPAPSGSDEQGNRPATPDANGVHDTKGGGE